MDILRNNRHKFWIVASILCLASIAVGQSDPQSAPTVIPSGDSGELHSAITDNLANEANKTNERLFVIFNRGTNDTNSRINDLRIIRLKAYFHAVQKRFGIKEPVYASGEVVKGEGQIDYYLGSNLRLIVYAKKNIVPKFTCCPDYQPPQKRTGKLKGTQK